MRPLFSMVSRDGRSWGQAWSLTPAIEAVLLEQRRICDDGGPDNVQVIAYSSHGRPLGPIMLAAQTTLARHCRLLVEPETPAPAPAPAPPPERESAHVHAQVSVQELLDALTTLLAALDEVPVAFGVHVHDAIDAANEAVVKAQGKVMPDDLSADGRKHGGGAGE